MWCMVKMECSQFDDKNYYSTTLIHRSSRNKSNNDNTDDEEDDKMRNKVKKRMKKTDPDLIQLYIIFIYFHST